MKYRVLLIDDNQIALESLQRTIPWEELKLEPVGCAYTGQRGCDMIAQLHPDIVISDIHMPEMDGLTMLEIMKQEIAGSRIIFITAYEKIEYASRAIRLSAFDFLLKPLDNEELVKSLSRAIRSLDEERTAAGKIEKAQIILRRARFLSALTAGSMENPGSVFTTFLDHIPHSYFFMVVESPTGVIAPLRRLEFASFLENAEIVNAVANNQLVLFCGFSSGTDSWKTTARRIADILQRNLIDPTIAISGLYQDPAAFYIAYQEGRQTILRHDVYGRRAQIEFAEGQGMNTQKHARLADLDQLCDKLVRRLDTSMPEEIWDTVLKICNGKLRIIRIVLMFLCTKVMQNRIGTYQWTESLDMLVYELTKIASEQEAKSWLMRFLGEIRQTASGTTRRSALVRNVVEYIRTHVTDGLLLEDVAKEFFVSPNYLSSIVHKETGITYRQHVIDAKMTVAKQMLDDTRMRAEDIAYAVGYENYVSFYNVFKRVAHMSPMEYRMHRKKEGEQVSDL